MKKKTCLIILLLLLLMVSLLCESFDFVYVDNKTFTRQLSYLNNGFAAVVLHIDPNKEDTSKNYAAPGKLIKEKIFNKKTATSSELIQLVLSITKKDQKLSGDGWYPTYMIYIKFTDRILYIIPSEKNMYILFDFKNSIVFIEGRKYVFDKTDAKLLQEKINYLLNNLLP